MACFVSLWRPLRQLSVTIAAAGSWRHGDDLEAAALLDEQTLEQVISPSWGAPLLGLPKPVADSHAKDALRQIPSNLRTSAAPRASREIRLKLGRFELF
jgi:hypothetical protein